jgi:hypothetical protein
VVTSKISNLLNTDIRSRLNIIQYTHIIYMDVRLHGRNRYDPMDGGGRTVSGTTVESRVWTTIGT